MHVQLWPCARGPCNQHHRGISTLVLLISFVHADAEPTLLKLINMKEPNGTPLRFIERVAAGDYTIFGICLLQDENGYGVDIIKNDSRHHGDKDIVCSIIQKWVQNGGPTCTYQHLIKCLNQSGLGALAEAIAENNVQQ